MDQVLRDFEQKFAHIEIDKTMKPTIEYHERGHHAKGDVVFFCEHDGTIDFYDKIKIHGVLRDAFKRAAYINSIDYATSWFNGEEFMMST